MKDMPLLYEGFAGTVVHDKALFTAKPCQTELSFIKEKYYFSCSLPSYG
jgi:hypothetical protein